MKAKFSSLELLQFHLLKSSYAFNVPKKDEIDIQALFNTYVVEIDFSHLIHEDGSIQVEVQIDVNNTGRKKAGYSFGVSGIGAFKLNNEENLGDDLTNNLRMYSTTNMMINNLRNAMFQISNIGPMGGYLLPPIDILDLFKKKEEQENISKK